MPKDIVTTVTNNNAKLKITKDWRNLLWSLSEQPMWMYYNHSYLILQNN